LSGLDGGKNGANAGMHFHWQWVPLGTRPNSRRAGINYMTPASRRLPAGLLAASGLSNSFIRLSDPSRYRYD